MKRIIFDIFVEIFCCKMLKIIKLQTGFQHKNSTTTLLESLSFEVAKGELCVILGRNGMGKTTLLRTIAGLHSALGGSVKIGSSSPPAPKGEFASGTGIRVDSPLGARGARNLAIVTTERFRLSYFRVEDVVALGRYPHTGYFGNLQKKDKKVIENAIQLTNIKQLIHKPLAQLSDGEYQKVMIARALAQDTPLLLLDEPTAHLDLVNRIAIFQLLKKLSSESKRAVLCTTHEVELALQIADKIVLLAGEKQAYIGTSTQLIEQGYIEAAYAAEGIFFDRKSGRFGII